VGVCARGTAEVAAHRPAGSEEEDSVAVGAVVGRMGPFSFGRNWPGSLRGERGPGLFS
jgi:hypothetical protein